MPIVKVKPIKVRLDRAVWYATRTDKTCIDGRGQLGADPDTPGTRWYATALNCENPRTAYADMVDTKLRYQKPGEVLGFRYIQSFKTGETTPEQAHDIGVEFARRCFGDRFQVVVGTHLDTETLHNHIIVNSVSFVDGKKYRSTPAGFMQGIRGTSDAVAREHGLSVIENPKGKGQHYAEWKAEQAGKPTLRTLLKVDIDDIVRHAYTFPTFLEELRKRGYRVDANPNHKSIVVIPPGTAVHIRLSAKLGDAYTEQGIKDRLARQRAGVPDEPEPLRAAPGRYRQVGHSPGQRPKAGAAPKLKGFIALYYHYLYFLKIAKVGRRSKRLPFDVRKEVIKLEKYNQQFLYLYQSGITTAGELQAHRAGLQGQIDALTQQRKPLYAERRNAARESTATALSQQISEITAALRQLRRVRAICDAVALDAPQVAEKIRQAQEIERQQAQQKEKTQPEKQKFRL